MKHFGAWLAMAGISATAAMPAHAQDVDVYESSGPWAMDYGEDYCRLARTFSNGDETLSLGMDRIQPGPIFRLILISDGIRLYRGAEKLGFSFLPDGAERSAIALRSETGDGQQYLNLGPTMLADMAQPEPGSQAGPPPSYSREEEKDAARSITGLELQSGVIRPVRIETGPLADAIGALQTCTDELVAYWGLDAEAHKTLSRPVSPASKTADWLPGGTIGFGDFPKLGGGHNQVRLMVDKSGKPAACHIHWAMLDESTNRKICDALMERASFTPALDAAGEAIDSYWIASPFLLMPGPGGS
ncbi:hypothetical protein FHS61_000899 [Altererythrobacter atlanticus]|uniref:Uncharacterized protein n=1 Tax=Croceibacterium atlanticum TaxID=1267766 RepID=A0A0F7KSL3_9SPHN|nr:hypothetical protein [Croceibacterium atlanticum]AKH43398.1 hypothetical protein WYH_02366 [Croceibacterium atlanticum]MBB5731895.1 hypothetical protein [Croceibacterium atlanticum]